MASEEDLLRSAREAEAVRDAAAAYDLYVRVVEAAPREDRARTSLARLDLAAGKPEAALAWIEPLVPARVEPSRVTSFFC